MRPIVEVLAGLLVIGSAAMTRGAGRAPPAAPPPLGVLEYGPSGAARSDDASIKVRFDGPVVPFAGDRMAAVGDLLRLTPAVAGRTVWVAPDLLVFEPDRPLPRATAFSVTLDGVVASDGRRLARRLSWRFETERPSCEVATRSRLLGPRSEVVFACTQFPVREGVERWVRATADGRPVSITPVVDRGVIRVRPDDRWPSAAKIAVTVAGDLRGSEGPLALGQAAAFSGQVVPELAVATVRCPQVGAPIEVVLTTPVDEDQARRLQVHPRPGASPLSIGVGPESRGSERDPARDPTNLRWVVGIGRTSPAVTYEVTVPAGLRDVHGQVLAAGVTRRLDCPPAPPRLRLSEQAGVLEAHKPATIGIVGRALGKARLRAVVLDDELLERGAQRLWRGSIGSRNDDLPARSEIAAVPLIELGRVIEEPLDLGPPIRDGEAALALDLRRLGAGPSRPVVIEVDAPHPSASGTRGALPAQRGLFQISDLAAVGWRSPAGGIFQVIHLSTGRGAPEVAFAVSRAGGAFQSVGLTGADGIIRLPGAAADAAADRSSIVLARSADRRDLALLPFEGPDALSMRTSLGLRPGERVVGLLVTERDLYQPGERVHFVGWAAIASPYVPTGLRALDPGTPARVVLRGDGETSRDELAGAALSIDAHGKLWGDLELPAQARGALELDATVGRARPRDPAPVAQDDEGDEGDEGDDDDIHAPRRNLTPAKLRVNPVRASELVLQTRALAPEVVAGALPEIELRAHHRSGGTAAITRVEATTSCRRVADPGELGWKLGDGWLLGVSEPYDRDPGETRRSLSVPLDEHEAGRGRLRFSAPLAIPDPWRPARCDLGAAVSGASGRPETDSVSFTAHPTSFYLAVKPPVGGRTDGPALRLALKAIGTGGRRVAAESVSVTVTSVISERVVASRRLHLPAAGPPVVVTWPELPASTYEVRVQADDHGRPVGTRFQVSVAPFEARHRRPAPDDDEEGPVHIRVPRRARVGRLLEVSVDGAIGAASGLLAVIRADVRELHPLHFVAGAAQLRLTAGESWVPGVRLEAVAIFPSRRRRARLETASAEIDVPADHRALGVVVSAPAEARPGAAVEVRVRVRDGAGRPVPSARVALWAVDEGILALTGYAPPDPQPTFLPPSKDDVRFFESFSSIIDPFARAAFARGEWAADEGTIGLGNLGATGYGRGEGGLSAERPVEVRSRFETTPLFLGDVPVDAAGGAQATLNLPHNLTTFRITAMAAAPLAGESAPARFGQGSAPVRVSLPFLLQPLAPRFLRPGDQGEVVVVAQNRSAAPGQVAVTIGAEGVSGASLEVQGPREARGALAPGEERRFTFEVTARQPGAAILKLAGRLTRSRAGGDLTTDQVLVPLEVLEDRRPREEIVVSGDLAAGEARAIPLGLPATALDPRSAGDLVIELGADFAGPALAAVQALVTYPFGCAEQTTSRMVPFITFRGLAEQAARRPAPALVGLGATRLAAFRAADGRGLAFWPRTDGSSPFATAWAALVLGRAVRAGLIDAPPLLEQLLPPLHKLVGERAPRSPEEPRPPAVVRAWAALALAEAGSPAPASALDDLVAAAPLLPPAVVAMVALALAGEAARPAPSAASTALLLALAGRVPEHATTAHLDHEEALPGFPVASSSLAEALVLWAFARIAPDHPLTTKLARGLVQHRGSRGWPATLENAIALLALEAHGSRAVTGRGRAALRATVGAGGREPSLADETWGGNGNGPAAGAARVHTVPISSLRRASDGGLADALVVRASGVGRVLFALSASFVSADAAVAADRGLRVDTALRTPQGPVPIDVPLSIGALVALDVTLSTRAPLGHVAIEVALPAGLEPLDLTGAAEARSIPEGLVPFTSPWMRHEARERDRVMMFFDWLPPGAHRHTILARAVTAGRFAFPGAQAHTMYSPDVRGWSGPTTLVVAPAVADPREAASLRTAR